MPAQKEAERSFVGVSYEITFKDGKKTAAGYDSRKSTRYMGAEPAVAGKKAGKELFRRKEFKNVAHVVVTIRESTRKIASKKHAFTYKVTRQPVKLERDTPWGKKGSLTHEYTAKAA